MQFGQGWEARDQPLGIVRGALNRFRETLRYCRTTSPGLGPASVPERFVTTSQGFMEFPKSIR